MTKQAIDTLLVVLHWPAYSCRILWLCSWV